MSVDCGLASGGRFVVARRTRASGRAIVGLARRSFFGLRNTNGGSVGSRVLVVGTSGFAPISRALVPANVLRSMRKAPVSFHHPAPVKGQMGSSFRRLRFNRNCSRG